MDWANFARSIFLKRMKTMKRRISALLLVLVLICSLSVIPADAAPPANTATILFTHDLHSHFLPQPAENGGESGGYARLKTAIDREREKNPDALLLDGGDFSIGSLIQTLYTTRAAELRTMGALGYDATTIGNHEFDHTGTGFAQPKRNSAIIKRPSRNVEGKTFSVMGMYTRLKMTMKGAISGMSRPK